MITTQRIVGSVSRNPLWLREWRASSRLVRLPVLLGMVAFFATGFCMLVMSASVSSEPPAAVARSAYQMFFGIALVFVTMTGAAFAASSIAQEREGKTWEALVMAGLTPAAIDRGKFLAAYTQLSLYLFALFPTAALPHLYLGVSLFETLAGMGVLFAVGAVAVRIGLLVSAVVPTARVALLVTVATSAAASFLFVSGGMVVSSLLVDRIEDFTGPMFWPVALARQPFGFDYARYLVYLPVAVLGGAWLVMRALTIAALTTNADRRHEKTERIFMWSWPFLAFTLGLMPSRAIPAVAVAQSAYAAFIFCAIVTLGLARGPIATRFGTSMKIILGTIIGTLVVSSLGYWMVVSRTDTMLLFGSRLPAVGLAFYTIAFALFLVGLAAQLRSRVLPIVVARTLIVVVAIVASAAPFFVAAAVHGWSGTLERWCTAFSPLSVIRWEAFDAEIPIVAALWALLGTALLGAAWSRERARAKQA